jgi:hypothetical protein
MKLRHKLRLALVSAGLVILIIGAGQALADFSHDDWQHVKDIELPSDFTNEGLIEVIPDSEVFARANPGLTDLRIVAGDGVPSCNAPSHQRMRELTGRSLDASVRPTKTFKFQNDPGVNE